LDLGFVNFPHRHLSPSLKEFENQMFWDRT
jgi:hypothetical protein